MSEVQNLVDQLLEPNKRMLELLLRHLEKVSKNAKVNMMTVSNLGVCFGPTLLRNEEETVAAIMDIKFGNVVVEIMIENWRQILCGEPPKVRRMSSQNLTVLPMNQSSSSLPGVQIMASPPHLVSPNRPPPPPYLPPPPPHMVHGGSTSSLVGSGHPVINTNGHKQVMVPNNMSPQQQLTYSPPYNSATWERSIRGNSTSSINKMFVPQPLGSAPPSSSLHLHRTVQPTLSNSSAPSYGMPAQEHGEPMPMYRHPPPPSAPKSRLHRQSSGNVMAPRPVQSSPGSEVMNIIGTSTEDLQKASSNSALRKRQPRHPKQRPPPAPNHPPYAVQESPRARFSSSSSSVDSYTSGGGNSSKRGESSEKENRIYEDEDKEDVSDNAVAAAMRDVENVREAANATLAEAAMYGSPTIQPQTATVQPLQQLQQQQTTPISSSSPSSTTSSTAPALTTSKSFMSSSIYFFILIFLPLGKGLLGSGKVRTLYACVGEHDSELSFEPNQIITSSEYLAFFSRFGFFVSFHRCWVMQIITILFFTVRPSPEPGWLQGILDGKIGLVPENYVEFIA